MKEIVLLTDMNGIWFDLKEKEVLKIKKRIAPQALKYDYVFQKLKKKARVGKLSSFYAGMQVFKKAKLENFVELEMKFLMEEEKNIKKVFVLRKNAEKVLRKLSKKVRIIGISDAVRTSREYFYLLKSLGISKYFEAIYSSHDLGKEKPEAFKYFTYLKKNFDVYFLGHSDDEIIGAKKFGFKTIGLKNKNADIKINKLEDLLKIFN